MIKKWLNFRNLTLILFPAVSPILNPCRQVWKYLSRACPSNQPFKDGKERLDAWNECNNYRETVIFSTSRLCE
jgi:hypothetical protein